MTCDEFLGEWSRRNLGSALEAVILCHHLDVDRNGHIQESDVPWIVVFFDRNSERLLQLLHAFVLIVV